METSLSTSLLLVESTFFLNDTKAKNGNCLYFNSQGQCVQNGVCSTSCYLTSGQGYHSYVVVNKTQNSTNYVSMTSICSCGKIGTCSECLLHRYGEFLSSNVNISKSLCRFHPAIYFDYGRSSVVKFCSFKNCNASDCYCITLYNVPSKLSFSNVIGNTANECITGGFNQLTVEECVIKENKGKFLLSNDGGSSRIDVIHCIVSDNDYNYGRYFSRGNVYTESIATDKVDIIFAHLSTEVCKIDFDEKYQTDQVKYFIMSCVYECIFLPIILNSS